MKKINIFSFGIRKFKGWLLLILIVAFIINTSTVIKANSFHLKDEHLRKLILINDKTIPEMLYHQWTAKEDKYYGAIFNNDSVVSPNGTAHFIQTLICSYVSPESEFYRSDKLLQRMIIAGEGLLNLQHEDGTIDLLSTNFHSTPDLGFTIYPIALTYSIMQQYNKQEYGELSQILKKYMLKAGEALSTGGIHTPNHRWVVSGALAWINSFFPNPKYKKRIDQWLAEKIDIDPDGQYHERSTSVYTPVTNRSLIDIAQKMGYDSIYNVIRKNLDMTFYYVRSNGEIATESSKRQDKYQQSNMANYYLAYNYMAILDNNTRYAGMVKYIENSVSDEQLIYMLPLFLENANLLKELPSGDPLPTSYHKHFKYSDIVRIRKGAVDMSILTNNSTFYTYFKGEAALEAIRLASAFFGKGQFSSQNFEKNGNTYILSSTIYGPYYQPLPQEKIPETGEAWGQVPRTEREQSEIQTLHTKIYITESKEKATIKVVVDGPENLPVALELAFRSGGEFANVTPRQGIENAFLAKNGEYSTYTKGTDTISIGPGVVNHNWTQLRGALPKLQADCLYLTSYSPCVIEITIK